MKADGIDFNLLPDVMIEFNEHLTDLEHDLGLLVAAPESVELVSSAFRHLHTIKGDFAYCHAGPLTDFVHHIEGVIQALRERRFLCSALVAEALLQSIDNMRQMSAVLANIKPGDELPEASAGQTRLIDRLAAAANQPIADDAARNILLSMHGFNFDEPEPVATIDAATYQRAIEIGKQLASLLSKRMGLAWSNRGEFQLKFVLAMNKRYPQPASEQSLTLAVWWHDIGLLALNDLLLNNPPKPTSIDWDAYAEHPELSALALLAVAPECDDAARIIRQHHQWANGRGLRTQAYSGPIHPGALMLACADLLFDRVAGLSGEAFTRGTLRAVFDVSGGLESRFDAPTINAFESVTREFSLQNPI